MSFSVSLGLTAVVCNRDHGSNVLFYVHQGEKSPQVVVGVVNIHYILVSTFYFIILLSKYSFNKLLNSCSVQSMSLGSHAMIYLNDFLSLEIDIG